MRAIDRTGHRYGALVVQERGPDADNRPGRPRWHCVCDCGGTVLVEGALLKSGAVTSCGCGTNRSRTRAFDLKGKRYGRLTVLSSDGHRRWSCRCDCGTMRTLSSHNLLSGDVQSCGCAKGTHLHTRHGKKSPTYSSWAAMIARTSYPSNAAYAYYQRMGITVCDRWREFSAFLADMGERPSLDHTLDRWPDKMGNYEPGNCRWATRRAQANNRVTNKTVEWRGQSYTMAELSRATGLPKELLRHRITRAGWPVEDAVTAPLQQGSRTYSRLKKAPCFIS